MVRLSQGVHNNCVLDLNLTNSQLCEVGRYLMSTPHFFILEMSVEAGPASWGCRGD